MDWLGAGKTRVHCHYLLDVRRLAIVPLAEAVNVRRVSPRPIGGAPPSADCSLA
ncbi:MAG: hypothetical protein Q8O41_11050 [Candidatus Methanoperedens sp.]|nr:hypothetical protein [Candidatus Methanoperedens sp.]